MKKILVLLIVIFSGCAQIPAGAEPVKHFEKEKYLGKWYEIARLDHWFERGLSNVTAEYSTRDDGGIKVINRGYNPETKKWEEAEGRAYFTGAEDVGQLDVTFFWPFYGAYNIIELDKENYTYSLVCGNTVEYLWILSRTPKLADEVIERLLTRAEQLGFDIKALIFVSHEKIEKE